MRRPAALDADESDAIATADPMAGSGSAAPARGGSPRPFRRWSNRDKPPHAHFLFRWIFPFVIVGLAVATVLLGLDAKDLVLNSRDGTISRNPTDPAAPGFSAEVVPTPTLLVVHTTDKGELVGVAVMSLVSGDGGGTVLFFPTDLVVKLPTGDSTTLAKLFADAGNAGETVLRRQLTRMIDADIDSSIVLGSKTLAELIRPVAPLRYTLRDSVRTVQNGVTATLLRSGSVSISSVEQVQAATEVLSPGEATINRTARQTAFWQAWFDSVRLVPDRSSVLPTFDTGLPRFVKGLTVGTTRFEQAPFSEQTFKGLVLLVADTAGIRAITSTMIPFPQAYEPGARLLVELRNGVGDLGRNEPMSRRIVGAGGQIVVLGNVDAFGVARSSVVFYNEDSRARVESLARSIGVANVQFTDRPGSSIEVTVTIGADFTP